jgi:hypothetical protein
MAKSKKRVCVFYSWQSDLPKKTNQNAIREALNRAGERMGVAAPELKIVLDEATRDTSGSPNIALKILEKIEAADVFVADVTTTTPPGAPRPCPNPNVGYELGYAVAQLGWDRVILLFNTVYGAFPSDLPFDFIQNRASPFKLAESDPKSVRVGLAKFLETAIDAIVKKNPKRPAELRGLSREKIQHDHDVENMEWLMSAVHLPTLDQHILDLPHSITDKALWFYENYRGIVINSLFSLYDPALNEPLDKLTSAWNVALSHDNQYHDTPSGRVHIFGSPGDMPLSTDRQKAWDEIDIARREMRQALDQILERLRESYLEVRIHKTNAKAWGDYVAYQRDVERPTKLVAKLRKQKKAKKKKLEQA